MIRSIESYFYNPEVPAPIITTKDVVIRITTSALSALLVFIAGIGAASIGTSPFIGATLLIGGCIGAVAIYKKFQSLNEIEKASKAWQKLERENPDWKNELKHAFREAFYKDDIVLRSGSKGSFDFYTLCPSIEEIWKQVLLEAAYKDQYKFGHHYIEIRGYNPIECRPRHIMEINDHRNLFPFSKEEWRLRRENSAIHFWLVQDQSAWDKFQVVVKEDLQDEKNLSIFPLYPGKDMGKQILSHLTSIKK